jgi:hypothetical protein
MFRAMKTIHFKENSIIALIFLAFLAILVFVKM